MTTQKTESFEKVWQACIIVFVLGLIFKMTAEKAAPLLKTGMGILIPGFIFYSIFSMFSGNKQRKIDATFVETVFSIIKEHSPAYFVKNYDLYKKLEHIESIACILTKSSAYSKAGRRDITYEIPVGSTIKLLNSFCHHHHIFILPARPKKEMENWQAFDWGYDGGNDKIVVRFRSYYFEDSRSQEQFIKLLQVLQSDSVKFIVFDMRGNHGGSLHPGNLIIESIFGEHAVDWLLAKHCRAIHYRLTAENLKRFAANGEPNIETLRKCFANRQNIYVKIPDTKSADLFVRRKHIPKICIVANSGPLNATGSFAIMMQQLDGNIAIVGDCNTFEYGYGDVDLRPLEAGTQLLAFPMKYFEMKDDAPLHIAPTHTPRPVD
ncbi:MAG: hypothetical protein LBI56_03690 [Puniceicoccales bacterium]|jgi:hypothetical protein|nr:hypothetical protein [Puniceicoccales bacterium]